MDKNMIKIDDLLRQRMSDAEEDDRPAAWLQMRDLLDKQMPVRSAAVNWRRMFGYLAGVALLAALSVGGYQVSQSFNSTGPVADNTGNTNNTPSAPAMHGLAGTAINSLPDTRQQEEAAQQPAQATDAAGSISSTAPVASTSSASQQITTNQADKAGTDKTAGATNHNKNSGSVAKGNASASNKSQQSAQPADKQNWSSASGTATNKASEVASGNPLKDSKLMASNNTPKSGTKPTNKSVANNSGLNNNNQKTTNNNNPTNTSNTTGAIGAEQVANNNKPTRTKTGSDGQEATNRNNNDNAVAMNNRKPSAIEEDEYVERNIPIRKLEMEERATKNGIVMDTIFNGDDVITVRQRKESLAMNDEEASGSNINPAAAAPSAKKDAGEEDVPMQKLGDHRTSTKKMKNFNPQRFEEVVRNAKFRMGSVKFYPGIVGGINATTNGNFGIHGGLAANLTVGDRWSILTEVKYAHRFNSANINMQDDYIKDVKPATLNGQYVYTYDSMEHYYNFTSFGSLEVPLMLTYTPYDNRFVFMAGGNFRYNLKIDPAEYEQRYLLERPTYSTSEPQFETEKQILLSDFAPTMSISPMIGVGYNVRPALRLDLRLSQSIWNNASTKGQKEIYKSLYNMPQVQFNMTYRMSSNKPYKRAR